MKQKIEQFILKGMQRDVSISKSSNEFSFENYNIRITARENNTLLSITNEKGTKAVDKRNTNTIRAVKTTDTKWKVVADFPVFTDISGTVTFSNANGFDIKKATWKILINSSESKEYDVLNVLGPQNIILNKNYDDKYYYVSEGQKISRIPILIGECLGYTTIHKYLVVFTKAEDTDYIYKLDFNYDFPKVTILYSGNLGFNTNNPIETLAIYENEEIQKVYWVDGINQPRMINIAAKDIDKAKWTKTSFDAVPTLKLLEEVTIKRNEISNGVFPSGVIQYIFTYYNKYGQESNPFYTSPLYYTSFQDRGGSPEDKVSNSFNIKIKNLDKSFDYIRIYSILRTSIDAVPLAKKVADIAPALSQERQFSGLGDESSLQVNYSTQFQTSQGFTAKDFIVLSKNSNNPEISIDDLSEAFVETKTDGTIVRSFLINPNSTSVLTNGFKANLYTILKLPSKGSGSYEYCNIYEPSRLELYYSPSNPDVVYSCGITGTSKYLPSFTLGRSIIYDDIYYTEYDDDGTTGESIDPTELLYLGGESIIANTITQKDNTLFLGNIKLNKSEIPEELRHEIQTYYSNVTFEYGKNKYLPEISGYYPYENSLKYNSYYNKHFKYLEYYRFGIQFQHTSGKWTEPLWLCDKQNNLPIKPVGENFFTQNLNIAIPKLNLTRNLLKLLEKHNYVKIRPVVVYPSFSDRECICQGIVCPTVYNIEDRLNNSPFVQSSWFVRPDILMWDLDTEQYSSLAGNYLEFRHNRPIPSSLSRNAEIQCIWEPLKNTELFFEEEYFKDDQKKIELHSKISKHSECFYIDKSIITFHSPDIEFDTNVQNLNTEGLKLRIVGFVPLTSSYGDIDIQTSTPPRSFPNAATTALGFYNANSVKNSTLSNGSCTLLSQLCWMDGFFIKGNQPSTVEDITGYMIYPFHRNGSLNNQRYAEDGSKSALLKTKRLSNLKVSYNSFYFNNDCIWNSNEWYDGLADMQLVTSNEIVKTQLKAPKNSGLDNIVYYGNVDKALIYDTYGEKETFQDAISRYYGYPIVVSDIIKKIADTLEGEDTETQNSYYNIFNSAPEYLKRKVNNTNADIKVQDCYGVDPIRIKYRSTPHAVMVFNYSKDHSPWILPTLNPGAINSEMTYDCPENTSYYWSKKELIKDHSQLSLISVYPIQESLHQDLLNPLTQSLNYGYLLLAELYNDNIVNRFGGQTQEAFENNVWLPCGEAVSIYRYGNNGLKDTATICWEEGDTYYQRYDHIKTYPFTLEDQNCITDVVSFMCETKVNLDGRYDRNRESLSYFAITPENFNKVNDVYNQENNFFVYRALNYDKFSLDNFPNSITWTKEKQLGELVDTWTNITVASTLDLDGEKGEVASLNTFNNEVFAFQKHGISHILFNSRVQIPASDGVPIEITNGLKVDGKRYISEIGCHNKWSIAQSPNGIYFIDNITNGIYLFTGDSLEPISEKLGFSQWVGENGTMNVWNKEYNNFRTFYDKANGDVYFTTKNNSLCFSESLGQFTSFMSYENLPAMFNVENKFYSIKNNILWEQNAGEYNYFYDEFKPYYIKYKVNPSPYADKIFTNIEFRADSFENEKLTDSTFNKLLVENEYQYGELDLNYNKILPSSLKKKFRMWRANIPRDKSKKLNRIRNPWIYLTLLKDLEDNYKTEFHDLLVYYFE